MINREITYERDINKSYMKIPAVMETCLDEKLMFRKLYRGILPMEKCYVNGVGQYWYNISGKQALDVYCRMNTINRNFFEKLILRICSQLEILEWNLIDTRCLVIDPELIFLDHSGENIAFVLYPDTRGNFADEFRQLMEYLLTKLNHSDKEGVHQVYGIYSMMMNEAYSPMDIKDAILNRREKATENQAKEITEVERPMIEEVIVSEEKENVFQEVEQKVQVFIKQVKELFLVKKENKEEIPVVVYPEEVQEEVEVSTNPTICLATTLGEPRGVLIYEGMGEYPDFEIGKESSILGKNPRVKMYINRDTISQFHAKFDYYEKNYHIEDMNSTNGTFVNDEMLNYKEKRILSSGDVIRFADIKYRFL